MFYNVFFSFIPSFFPFGNQYAWLVDENEQLQFVITSEEYFSTPDGLLSTIYLILLNI